MPRATTWIIRFQRWWGRSARAVKRTVDEAVVNYLKGVSRHFEQKHANFNWLNTHFGVIPAGAAIAEAGAAMTPAASGASKRDPRIDVVRGAALMMIFVDHIPGNTLGSITLRNFGFSDAAEYSCCLPEPRQC